jgi:DNA-binding NarL/FixJ family response regulator
MWVGNGDENFKRLDESSLRGKFDTLPGNQRQTAPIRVGLILSRDIYRTGLRWVIEQDPDLTLVFAHDRILLEELLPNIDIVLISENLVDAREFGAFFRHYIQPGAVRLILWESQGILAGRSSLISDGILRLQSSCPSRLITNYIRQVAVGAIIPKNSPVRSVTVLQTIDQLELQDKIILQRISQGYTNREIGRELYIAESTVKKCVHKLLNTLECSHRAQAAAHYARYQAQYESEQWPPNR